MLEKEMENLIAEHPGEFLEEEGLKLIGRQVYIGNYRLDLLFRDRHGAKLIVEIQKGTLDRNHLYKILDYYDAYKEKRPSEFVECMVIANEITGERKRRLKSKGISYKEITEEEFTKFKEQKEHKKKTQTDVESKTVEDVEKPFIEIEVKNGSAIDSIPTDVKNKLDVAKKEMEDIKQKANKDDYSIRMAFGMYYASVYKSYISKFVFTNIDLIKPYLDKSLFTFLDFYRTVDENISFTEFYRIRKEMLKSLLNEFKSNLLNMHKAFRSILDIISSPLEYKIFLPTLEILGGELADLYYGYHMEYETEQIFLVGIDADTGKKFYRPLDDKYLEEGDDFVRIMPFYIALDGKYVDKLLDVNDDILIEKWDIKEPPKIELNWEVGEHLLNFALENKKYAINTPSEVIVNSGDIRSIVLLDSPPDGCYFKVKYIDNKVSIGYTKYPFEDKDGKGHETFFSSNFYNSFAFGGEDIKTLYSNLGDMYALICAVIRDFYVCEEREKLYEKREFKVSKKKKKKKKKKVEKEGVSKTPKIQYLPRFKIRYIGMKEESFREHVVKIAPHPVSGHLRRCTNPSPIQIELAKTYGIKVPDGFTFVKPHFKGEYEKKLYKSRSALNLIYS